MIWLLYIILWIILWILAGLAALALLLVLVPVHLRGRGSVQGFTADGVLELSWGWGFVKFVSSRRAIGEARLFGLRIWRYRHKTKEEKEQAEKKNREKKRKKEEQRKKKKQKKKMKQKKASTPESLKALGAWFNRKPLIELIRRMLATLRISLAIQGRLGTGDPADTAIIITVIRQLDTRMKYIRLEVEPVYEKDSLDLTGSFSGRLWLLHMAFVFVAALFNRDIRRALKALV